MTVRKGMKVITTTIKGITPLLMHNGRLADPLDPATQYLAKLTKKKNKTDEDHRAVGKAEWLGSLYLNDDGAPCLPGEVIEAALVEGAKKYKLGKTAKGGLIVEGNYQLEYKGPKDVDGLWESGSYLKRAGVKVKQARVIRSRPIFPDWQVTFQVHWDPSMIKDQEQVLEIIEAAGQTGIGDWRPKFGRFEMIE